MGCVIIIVVCVIGPDGRLEEQCLIWFDPTDTCRTRHLFLNSLFPFTLPTNSGFLGHVSDGFLNVKRIYYLVISFGSTRSHLIFWLVQKLLSFSSVEIHHLGLTWLALIVKGRQRPLQAFKKKSCSGVGEPGFCTRTPLENAQSCLQGKTQRG